MGFGFQGLGFGLQGFGFGLQGLGYGFQGQGCRVWVSGLFFFQKSPTGVLLVVHCLRSRVQDHIFPNPQRHGKHTPYASLKRFRLFPKRLPWKPSSLFLRMARFSVARHIPETALLVSRALGCIMVRSLSLRLFCCGGIC